MERLAVYWLSAPPVRSAIPAPSIWPSKAARVGAPEPAPLEASAAERYKIVIRNAPAIPVHQALAPVGLQAPLDSGAPVVEEEALPPETMAAIEAGVAGDPDILWPVVLVSVAVLAAPNKA